MEGEQRSAQDTAAIYGIHQPQCLAKTVRVRALLCCCISPPYIRYANVSTKPAFHKQINATSDNTPRNPLVPTCMRLLPLCSVARSRIFFMRMHTAMHLGMNATMCQCRIVRTSPEKGTHLLCRQSSWYEFRRTGVQASFADNSSLILPCLLCFPDVGSTYDMYDTVSWCR